MSGQPPAQWSPDPAGRFELRYWDGRAWTDHVASGGQQFTDQLTPAPEQATQPADRATTGWHPDPSGRHDLRYWDGRWTEHASSGGRQVRDPLPDPSATDAGAPDIGAPQTAPAPRPNRRAERQARRVGVGIGESGGGTLLTEDVLVVNQRANLIGSTLAYSVYDRRGNNLGQFQEVRRTLTAKMTDRVRGQTDSSREYRFQVVDARGEVVMAMTRPEQWFTAKSAMAIEDQSGSTIGQIVQETHGLVGVGAQALQAGATLLALTQLGTVAGMVAGAAIEGVSERLGNRAADDPSKNGHVRFGLESGGDRLGSIHALSSSAWEFRVLDVDGIEVGSITKTWAGWAKERFTKADNYVVQMDQSLEDPLRSLVVAAALAIDVALKQGVQTSGSTLHGTRRYR